MSWPWARKKLKHIAPPIRSWSARSEEAVDQRDLVGHLRAAEHDGERPLRILDEPLQRRDLALEQRPRRRRQVLGHADGRGVGAVHRAERVEHEPVREVGEVAREVRVVLRLARVPARVLEHEDLPGSSRAAPRRTSGPTTSGAWNTRMPSSSPSRFETGASDVSGSCPFGRPRCEHSTIFAPRARSSSIAGQRRADARVVGHLAALERHVEVGAHEHRVARLHLQVAEGLLAEAAHRQAPAADKSFCVRSTTRFE